MIKLIFSDMDGTLLDDSGRLPPNFPEIYARLREMGIRFIPASGRQYYSLKAVFAAYHEDMMFLADNGTSIVDSGKTIFYSEMDWDLSMEVLSVADSLQGVYSVFSGVGNGFILERHNVPEFRAEVDKFVPYVNVVDKFANIDDIPTKMSLCDVRGEAQETIYPFMEKYNDRLQVVQASPVWIDVMNLGINKGVAVEKVQDLLGVKPEECMAFGDFYNDAEMMTAVTHSFAMANAEPAVKKLARYEAPANTDYGVMCVIEDMLDGKYDWA